MKQIFLFSFLLFPVLLMAQSTTPAGNANPYGTNPYGTNPYDSNPYSGPPPSSNPNQSTNPQIGQYTEDAIEKMKEEKSGKSVPSGNGNEVKPQTLDATNFQDINQASYDNQNRLIEESYKSDPDYLRYVNPTATKSKESVENEEIKKKSSKEIFGMNFFQNNVFDLSDRAPSTPPLDYRLGPGDEVIVSLWGNAELQQTYKLAKDGSIFPKLVGKIYLQGLTFDAASSVISSKFKRIVPSNTSIEVQMGKSRTIRVTIVGEVKKQGTYTMSAFNSALNALFRAGGLTEIGNLRNIEIKRDGRTVEIVDIYEYLQSGKQGNEIYLEDNDYVYVGVYEKLIQAKGNFKRPMYYQLSKDEGLRDLIEFAGGPSSNARNSLIHIKTVVNEEQRYVDIPGREYFQTGSLDDFILNDGDLVDIKPINEGLKNIVSIKGEVNYPDEYEVRDDERLTDILQRAGGLTPSAYLPKAFIFRGENSLESEAIKIDLALINENKAQNVQIRKGDKIQILSNKDFEEKYTIEILGNVRKPGKVSYFKGMKLKDLLLLSGGLSLDAEYGRIEISNLVDTATKYNIQSGGSNIKTVSINSNLEIDQVSENILLKPLDRVYVRRKAEFLAQEKIRIVGEVKYPGEYVLVDKNERLSTVIKRAGGITETAFAEGAKLNRNKTGFIVIDLPAAISTLNSNQDIILRDSDLIIIPSANEIVSVRGEVQSPINIKYDSQFRDAQYYIASAGGYGERPWKNRISVKYQNGLIKNTKNFLFIRKFPKVREGSTVFVPQKAKKENQTKFTEVFSYTISAITSIATLIVLARSLK